jgi:hypothetical protein
MYWCKAFGGAVVDVKAAIQQAFQPFNVAAEGSVVQNTALFLRCIHTTVPNKPGKLSRITKQQPHPPKHLLRIPKSAYLVSGSPQLVCACCVERRHVAQPCSLDEVIHCT